MLHLFPRCSFHRQALYFLCHNWKILLAGQALSLLLASAGAAQATLHLDCGLSAPTFTMTLIYLGLSTNMILLIVRDTKVMSQQSLAQEEDTLDARETIILSNNDDDDLNLNDDFEVETREKELDSSTREVNGYKDSVVEDESTGKTDPAVENNLSEEPSNNSALTKYQSTCCCGLITLHQPLWWYLMLAFLDVEANAITVLAFRYTTLTSVTLFDALAIPSAVIISKCWLRRKYRCMHFVGVMVCMVGVLANVLTDYESDRSSNSDNPHEVKEYPHKLRGDVCAILGGILFGLGDVLTEATVSATGDVTEYLAMMGSFAFGISLVQSLLLEWDDLLEFFADDDAHSSTCSLRKGWALLFTFCGVTMLSYTGGSRFLMVSEAAFFNLSLLTGDLWSVIFAIVAERIVPQPLFFVALVFVLSGVVLYEMAPSPAEEKQQTTPPSAGDDATNIHNNANDGIVMTDEKASSRLMNGDGDDNEDDGIELL